MEEDDIVSRIINDDHMTSLFGSLQELYQRHLLTDIVLIAESQEFQAHMLVMAAHSPFFRDMLTNESFVPGFTVVVNNTSGRCLQVLLDYLYTGILKLTASTADLVCVTAQELQIQTAVHLCKQYLAGRIGQRDLAGQIGQPDTDHPTQTVLIDMSRVAGDIPAESVQLTEIKQESTADADSIETTTDETHHCQHIKEETLVGDKKHDLDLNEKQGSQCLVNGKRTTKSAGKRKQKTDCQQAVFTKRLSARLKEKLRTSSGNTKQATESRSTKISDLKRRTCEDCNKTFVKPYLLQRHQFSVHGIYHPSFKVYKCQEEGCSYVSHSQPALHRHQATHQTPKFQCTVCTKRLRTAEAVSEHIKVVHQNVRAYVCEICGSRFGSQKTVSIHIARIHNGRYKKYYCDNCPYSTKCKSGLRDHLFHKHNTLMTPKTQVLQCRLCEFNTMRQNSLNNHMFSQHGVLLDSNAKLWQCSHCDFKALKKCYLGVHMQKHAAQRTFQCKDCDKSYQTQDTLCSHIAAVHHPKTHVCEHCGFRASQKKRLRTHVRVVHTHPNYRPIRCGHCVGLFKTTSACWNHCKRMHKDKEVRWIQLAPS